MTPLPRWAETGLLPLLNLCLAMTVSGLVIAALGESPLAALSVMLKGAFVYPGGLGYTLYYTTNFIFTGLAVSIAFRRRENGASKRAAASGRRCTGAPS